MAEFKNRHIYMIALLAILVSLPLWVGGFLKDALILFFLYLAAAEVWGFMAKHAGIVSLGQQIFMGVGGYATAVICMYYGVPMWISPLIAGFLGAGLAGLLSFPLLRLRGVYFSIGTFLVAEVIRLFFNSWEYVGAGKGLIFRAAYGISTTLIYYPALAIGLLSIFLIYFIYHSKLGYGLRSIGADEDAASSMGVNTFKCKAVCFILASFITSLVGAVNVIHHTYLHPTSAFSISWTVNFIFVAVIGGVGTLVGPIIGSAIFVTLGYLLAQYLGLSLLLEGLVVIAILLAVPEGIWGVIRKKFKLHLKPPI
ncbi:MAG: branched-chain amino acid ABC transporter permease [Candidatus Bathyarchaeota archaeon]|nr:branched-chain amino acid ABC transporter permease [Candidatus Bathyarchaeota archaeon]